MKGVFAIAFLVVLGLVLVAAVDDVRKGPLPMQPGMSPNNLANSPVGRDGKREGKFFGLGYGGYGWGGYYGGYGYPYYGGYGYGGYPYYGYGYGYPYYGYWG